MITPRSSATHAPGSDLISTDALSPKIANFINNNTTIKGKKVFTEKLLQLNFPMCSKKLLGILTKTAKVSS